ANLYIDEGHTDWNNAHPWNDPVNNEWFVSQTDGAAVDGGQIDILDYTHMSNGNLSDSVAYSWGPCDSPFDFNDDLLDQQAAIQWYYSEENPEWSGSENPHPEWAEHDTTRAPDSDWNNYLPNYAKDEDGVLLPIANSFYPYRPGMNHDASDGYTWRDVYYSAGVDCGGLVRRSASYTGNSYNLDDAEEFRVVWDTINIRQHNKDGRIIDNVDVIWRDEYDPFDRPEADDIVPLEQLRPGDIVLCETTSLDEDGNPLLNYPHVMIVQRIEYDDDGLNRDDIIFIEAADGIHHDLRVINTQTLWTYRDHPNENIKNGTLVVCRLRQ
ncbi:MAG: hypothetical protein ACLFR1_13480, partial [Spirochaetia bacterium]